MSFPRPGCCPACGNFVSVRTKHAYRCRPQALPSQEVPWSGRSPMVAWPDSHRVQRDGRVWLTSPVPGIGPRLLVLLAQHRSHARRDLPNGKRARYGPLHALKDLLELTPEQVREEALQPAPAWVPCGGTWHRILLWNGDLWAMEHGELDVEAERVAAVLGGHRLTGCVAALADWTDRADAARLLWLDTLASLDAAASWGIDELAARDSWIDARVRREAVDQAATFGIDDVELLRWVDWLRRPDRIAEWRQFGWTSGEAQQLRAYGVLPPWSAHWRSEGLDVGLIADAVEYDFPPAAAGQWWRAGFSLHDADLLSGQGVDVAEALRRKARYGTAARVVTLVRMSA